MSGLSTLWLLGDRDWLSISSDVAQAVTGAVASILGTQYFCRAKRRRVRLEDYLKGERKHGWEAHTVLHLIANTAMTEAEIFEAAHSSSKIKAIVSTDEETGRADQLFFRYVGGR
jgi:hypothetical protein